METKSTNFLKLLKEKKYSLIVSIIENELEEKDKKWFVNKMPYFPIHPLYEQYAKLLSEKEGIIFVT